MAGFLEEISLRERSREEAEENWKRRYILQRGVSNVFILDTSESMDGEGFNQMREAFISMIEGYALHPNLNENVAVIQFGKDNKYLHYFSNDYDSLKRVLDDVSCSGPSPMIEGFLLAIPGLEDIQRMANIGLFYIRARVILISDGKPTTFDDSDSKFYDHHTEGDYNVQLLEQVKQIGKTNPIICVPVGKDPNICLLGSIAYGSRGGKILNYKEAKEFAKYTLSMIIASEILGNVPPTFCTIDDVKSIVLSSRHQSDITKTDLENVVEILNNRRAYEIFVYGNEEHLEHDVYSERSESLLAPGTRVRRGPNWHYSNQDSNGPGTVTGHWDRDGWVFVEWDTGLRFPYEYVSDSQQLENVIKPCDEPRILQRENIAVGCIVKRGSDWKWGDQDGGEGNIGAVYRVKENAVYVRWSNGNKSNYRFGYDEKYDIVVCDPFDESIVGSQICSRKSICIGDSSTGNFVRAKGKALLESEQYNEKDTFGLINIEKTLQSEVNLESYKEYDGAFLWQWKNKLGRWNNFPKAENQKIDKSFAQNSRSTILLAINGQMFRLVLSKMKLINISSRETFDVRRFENNRSHATN